MSRPDPTGVLSHIHEYSTLAMTLYVSPRNEGLREGADGEAEREGEGCTERIRFQLFTDPNSGEVKAARFEADPGCPAVMAALSMATLVAIGRSLPELANLSAWDLLDSIGRVPAEHVRCVEAAAEALHKAAKDGLARGEGKPTRKVG